MQVPVLTRGRHALARAAKAVQHAWATLGYGVPAADTVELAINSRYRRRLATADGHARRITLRGDFAGWPAPMLRSVLIHELAHLAVHERDGRVRPHGEQWRALMRAAGLSSRAMAASSCGTGARRPRLQAEVREKQTRSAGRLPYEHRCPVCHMVRYAKRPVPAWRCRTCLGQGLDGMLSIRQSDRS